MFLHQNDIRINFTVKMFYAMATVSSPVYVYVMCIYVCIANIRMYVCTHIYMHIVHTLRNATLVDTSTVSIHT